MQNDIVSTPIKGAETPSSTSESVASNNQSQVPASPPIPPVMDVVTKAKPQSDQAMVAQDPSKNEQAITSNPPVEEPAKPKKRSAGTTGAIVFALFVCTALIGVAVYVQILPR